MTDILKINVFQIIKTPADLAGFLKFCRSANFYFTLVHSLRTAAFVPAGSGT